MGRCFATAAFAAGTGRFRRLLRVLFGAAGRSTAARVASSVRPRFLLASYVFKVNSLNKPVRAGCILRNDEDATCQLLT